MILFLFIFQLAFFVCVQMSTIMIYFPPIHTMICEFFFFCRLNLMMYDYAILWFITVWFDICFVLLFVCYGWVHYLTWYWMGFIWVNWNWLLICMIGLMSFMLCTILCHFCFCFSVLMWFLAHNLKNKRFNVLHMHSVFHTFLCINITFFSLSLLFLPLFTWLPPFIYHFVKILPSTSPLSTNTTIIMQMKWIQSKLQQQ